VPSSLGRDRVEIGGRLHAEDGLTLRGAGLDRRRQPRVVGGAEHDGSAVLAAEHRGAILAALREPKVRPEAPAGVEIGDAEHGGIQVRHVHQSFPMLKGPSCFRERRS
jgi:hypothetical protein